ncbi:beta strand repeat-containing protein [Psychrobacter sp. 4Bb]|uniref:beta strand repeat-containing protein n=1 Tax=Psychrobacter sp. 4Bb TaxID=888436 RepID=UPI000C7BDCE4|nr:DUF11 domain-containing protein [Psychrobacter sp. 4Bb]PKH81558.1 hypothetical protein CXF60_04200 [Psychrobacter sp. 4Bb]
MKSNTFNYSMLAVGVAAVMGLSTGANAANPTGGTSGSFNVTNKATASYTVAGSDAPQNAESNVVTVNVTETGSFSLVSTVVDDTKDDDFGKDRPINAQANSTVDFTHTLTNGGNVNDTYKITLANAVGDNFDYNLGNSVIKYQKVNAAGTNVGNEITIVNNESIALAPGEKALITITAQADTKRVADTNGILTVTAESTYLKSKPANTASTTYTAVNTDNALTKTPIYAITKSATTNLGNKNFDLNNTSAFVDYTITVKNEGNLDGTAISISDDLPSGLVAIASGEANYKAPTVATSNGSATGTAVLSNSNKTVTVAGQNVKVGETITVTFRAKKATDATTNSLFTNYAVVKDNTNSDVNANTPDIIDRSDDGVTPGGLTESTYENTATPLIGKDDNTNATVTTTNQTRAIAITPGANKEVALITPTTNNDVANTYTYTITNNGTDITEAAGTGDNDSSVKLSIKPTATRNSGIIDDPNISITRVYVDANNNGKFDTGETELVGVNGIYELNAATPFVTGSTTNRKGLAPGESVKIGVQVTTSGEGSNDSNSTQANVNNIGDFETLTLSIQPKGPVNGTAVPTSTSDNPLSTTSTTIMQGINLAKYQIVDSCGASPAVNSAAWVTGNLTATAAQCIFYKLESKNTFTDSARVINNLVVSDTLAPTLTYQANSFSASPTATDQSLGQTIKVTFATVNAGATANVVFSAKPSQTGTNQ